MPPQPRSGIKPDPTMLLCYVPDLVFTLIRDVPQKFFAIFKKETRMAPISSRTYLELTLFLLNH